MYCHAAIGPPRDHTGGVVAARTIAATLDHQFPQVLPGEVGEVAAPIGALKEEARELVPRAAAVDTILQRQPESGSLTPPADESAMKGLARHGYPFAGLLRTLQPEDRSIDGLVRELEGRPRPSLRSLFGGNKKRAGGRPQR